PHHHIPLAEASGLRIAHWPEQGLTTYRSRVDATARAEYEAALAARSPAQLARVARDYFASSYGDDALWALGTLELEQGHYAAARRAWTRLLPQMLAPDGRPWGVALVGADLSQPDVWQRV